MLSCSAHYNSDVNLKHASIGLYLNSFMFDFLSQCDILPNDVIMLMASFSCLCRNRAFVKLVLKADSKIFIISELVFDIMLNVVPILESNPRVKAATNTYNQSINLNK